MVQCERYGVGYRRVPLGHSQRGRPESAKRKPVWRFCLPDNMAEHRRLRSIRTCLDPLGMRQPRCDCGTGRFVPIPDQAAASRMFELLRTAAMWCNNPVGVIILPSMLMAPA